LVGLHEAAGVFQVLTSFKLSSRFSWLRSAGSGGANPGLPVNDLAARMVSTEAIAQAMRAALAGCDATRPGLAGLLRRIDAAIAPHTLWHMRVELYAQVAFEFSQAEAQQRVNALLPLFEGWVTESQRKPI
jgi:hypothetical protein